MGATGSGPSDTSRLRSEAVTEEEVHLLLVRLGEHEFGDVPSTLGDLAEATGADTVQLAFWLAELRQEALDDLMGRRRQVLEERVIDHADAILDVQRRLRDLEWAHRVPYSPPPNAQDVRPELPDPEPVAKPPIFAQAKLEAEIFATTNTRIPSAVTAIARFIVFLLLLIGVIGIVLPVCAGR